jgi:5-(carboxyamino)imidazole ribonucleotide mutase
MPRGVPVGVMGIDSAYNAAIFACQILSLKYPRLKRELVELKQLLEKEVAAEDAQLNNSNNNNKQKQKGNFSERYSLE